MNVDFLWKVDRGYSTVVEVQVPLYLINTTFFRKFIEANNVGNTMYGTTPSFVSFDGICKPAADYCSFCSPP